MREMRCPSGWSQERHSAIHRCFRDSSARCHNSTPGKGITRGDVCITKSAIERDQVRAAFSKLFTSKRKKEGVYALEPHKIPIRPRNVSITVKKTMLLERRILKSSEGNDVVWFSKVSVHLFTYQFQCSTRLKGGVASWLLKLRKFFVTQ
ncbi:hypothetical protein ES288_A03G105000v1 [Gossypium darwinii]|uniref:Uncharacterized protein n=1 Tax=Gossypium darwinii TaxID=34276 RepID=A0A5D2H563_GOSDA|nr:hypothetical protein ES288_A03G105000v1 [Gossypium darwinii]